jgi:hypothetical protein
VKKAILFTLIASTMFFNAGCDDSDVAAGIIGAGIGIGIGAIAAGGNSGYHNGYHDGYHDGRRDDRWGRPGRYHGCGRYRCYDANITLDNVDAMAALDPQVVEFAEKHNISTAASAKIQTAFVDAQTKGISSFDTVGLNKNDLTSLAKFDLPEASSIKNMAAKLDMSEAQSRDLLKGMIQDFKVQASDANSDYWKACVAKGKWKTAENQYCASTSWSGCSPATGATLCY